MKKIILIIISVSISLMTFSSLVFAANSAGELCRQNSDCEQGLICHQGEFQLGTQVDGTSGRCRTTIDALTQRQDPKSTNPIEKDAVAVANLPDVSLEGGMTLAIKTILKSAMLLTIIAIVVAAIYYIISRGKDEDMTKAKDIILYLIIGMAIIAAAYGIIAGVTQFDVFK